MIVSVGGVRGRGRAAPGFTDALHLRPEPGNEHDPHAVEVRNGGEQRVGYLRAPLVRLMHRYGIAVTPEGRLSSGGDLATDPLQSRRISVRSCGLHGAAGHFMRVTVSRLHNAAPLPVPTAHALATLAFACDCTPTATALIPQKLPRRLHPQDAPVGRIVQRQPGGAGGGDWAVANLPRDLACEDVGLIWCALPAWRQSFGQSCKVT